jgi:hypothetical protein
MIYNKQLVDNLPFGKPTEVNGEWFYKTREALFVLRISNGDLDKFAVPTWVYVGHLVNLLTEEPQILIAPDAASEVLSQTTPNTLSGKVEWILKNGSINKL